MDWIDQGIEYLKKGKNKLLKKVKEEKQQYSQMGGPGEYVANNAVSAVKKTAKKMGLNEIATAIEQKRQQLVQTGVLFDKKIKEEYQQYKESNGLGEYVAGNAVSVAKKAVESVSNIETSVMGHKISLNENSDLAEKIEGKRAAVVAKGKAFDDKVKEEKAQYNQSGGLTEYLAGNAVTVARKLADTLGFENVAEKIEDKRSTVVGLGKLADKGMKEAFSQEYAIYKEMGGLYGYVTNNTVSAAQEVSRSLGKSDWVEKLEAKRPELIQQANNYAEFEQQEWKKVINQLGLDELFSPNTQDNKKELKTALQNQSSTLSGGGLGNVRNKKIDARLQARNDAKQKSKTAEKKNTRQNTTQVNRAGVERS